ncbi:hypothetical protein [Fluviicola sp.]|uniref:hypothetical protein n=1 Tax=Fluviicola sp. TaxID=1917219 RepID=UPI002636EC49|nr:hypothetical protein [Fluviicola sp.]
MKASQTKTSGGKQHHAIQSKAKNQASESTLLKAYSKGKIAIQRKKVSDDHVRDDLLHPESNNLFKRSTNSFFAGKLHGTKAKKADDEQTVHDNRDQVSYEQLKDSTLQNNAGLKNWLSSDGEHMYVHNKSSVQIATRADNKLPHPTLVGGDPDVKGAGTMYMTGKKVYITKLSGHFRPSKVHNDTVKFVEGIHHKKGEEVHVDDRV